MSGQMQTAAPRLVLLGKIASGGMGTVSLARREDDGTLVAVKRMHRHLSNDAEFLKMFLDEIWMTGALDHPNVVKLCGWGVDEAGPYLATELVMGTSLGTIAQDCARDGMRMATELVTYAAARVADGLHAAHSLRGNDGRVLGIVHRDITPSNVLVAFDGRVKITDFGVARATSRPRFTQTGILKGKVGYMAPEYARGEAIDGRSDLYSLGVVMFELLSGRRPFECDNDMELLKIVARQPAPSLREVAPEVDPTLAGAIDRALSHEVQSRHRAGAELAAALDEWLLAAGHDAAALRLELGRLAHRYGEALQERIDGLVSAVHEDDSELPVLIAQHSAPRALAPLEPVSERIEPTRPEAPEESHSGPHTRAVRPAPAAPLSESAEAVTLLRPSQPPEPLTASQRVVAPALRARGRMLAVSALSAAAGGIVVAAAMSWRTVPVAELRGGDGEVGRWGDLVPPIAPSPHPAMSSEPPSRSLASAQGARSAPQPAPRPKPSNSSRPQPRAHSCTPQDWDYPRCLQGGAK